MLSRLKALVERIGKDKIVIDLSCKRRENDWLVMKDNWQTETDLLLSDAVLEMLSSYCDEFLIHATDLEGKCSGIDVDLIKFLGNYSPLSATYAGGVTSLEDLDFIKSISSGKVDVTIGSGLDLFGGTMVKYKDCVSWNNCN
jgi:phosphoribosylformimino-5-aminoimidazole carboxamide ribotide isomerase